MNRSGVRALVGAVIIAGAVFEAVPSVGAQGRLWAHSATDEAHLALFFLKSGLVPEDPEDTELDINFGLARLPGTATVTDVEIHQGQAGVNGPIVTALDFPPFSTASGDQIVVPLPAFIPTSIASQIIANPGNFYVEFKWLVDKTTAALRAQLESSADPFAGVGFTPFSNALFYLPGDPFQFKLFIENAGETVSADAFAFLALPPDQNCSGKGNLPLLFLGGDGTFEVECLANLASPGSHAIPLARNLSIPSFPLREFMLFSASVPPGAPTGPSFAVFCLAMPNMFPGGQIKCGANPFAFSGQ